MLSLFGGVYIPFLNDSGSRLPHKRGTGRRCALRRRKYRRKHAR